MQPNWRKKRNSVQLLIWSLFSFVLFRASGVEGFFVYSTCWKHRTRAEAVGIVMDQVNGISFLENQKKRLSFRRILVVLSGWKEYKTLKSWIIFNLRACSGLPSPAFVYFKIKTFLCFYQLTETFVKVSDKRIKKLHTNTEIYSIFYYLQCDNSNGRDPDHYPALI